MVVTYDKQPHLPKERLSLHSLDCACKSCEHHTFEIAFDTDNYGVAVTRFGIKKMVEAQFNLQLQSLTKPAYGSSQREATCANSIWNVNSDF